jgi:uracil-DNA glycosylase
MPPFDDFRAGLCSWQGILKGFTESKKFQEIYTYVKGEYESKTIYPPPEDIFNAFRLTPLDNLKVVIVGQDPYHQPGQAHGLCFSVKRPVPPPPSLKNIFKNMKADPGLKFKEPEHGDLTRWAKQGVLLLNALLTVERSTPMAHKDCGWEDFTSHVIKQINQQTKDVVFLLWGAPAKKKAREVDRKRHRVLETSHPSPLSAHQGFLDSKCFSECNRLLEELGKKPIDWNLD